MLSEKIESFLSNLDGEIYKETKHILDPVEAVAAQIKGIVIKKNIISFEDSAELEAFGRMMLPHLPRDTISLLVSDVMPPSINNDTGRYQQKIDKKYLEYWHKKAEFHTNKADHQADKAKYYTQSFLKSVYCDLVVTYTPLIDRKAASKLFYERAIESSRANCSNNKFHSIYRIKQIERALRLALELGDELHVEKITKQILSLHKCIFNHSNEFMCFAFRILLLDYRTKYVTKDIEEQLVYQIEERLSNNNNSLAVVRSCVALLLPYYSSKNGQEKKMFSLLKKLEEILLSAANRNGRITTTLAVYDRLIEANELYADKSKLLAENLKILVHEKDRILEKTHSDWEMQPRKGMKIEEYWGYLFQLIFGPEYKASLGEIFQKIASIIFRDSDVTKFIGIDSLYDDLFEEGQVACKMLLPNHLLYINIEMDQIAKQDNNFMLHVYCGVVMPRILDIILRIYRPDDIVGHFKKSSLFGDETFEQFESAFIAYIEGNFRVAYHLFIPLIESRVRLLFESVEGKVSDISRYSYKYYSITKIFKENRDKLERVFSNKSNALAAIDFMKYMLVDPEKINLRNKFAHGIDMEFSNERIHSDLLFLIVVVLSTVSRTGNS